MQLPAKHWMLTLTTGISLSLMTSLTGCATQPRPDDKYLADCKLTYLKDGPVTNADVYRLAKDREYDLKTCNLDKAAIRAWYDSQRKWYQRRVK